MSYSTSTTTYTETTQPNKCFFIYLRKVMVQQDPHIKLYDIKSTVLIRQGIFKGNILTMQATCTFRDKYTHIFSPMRPIKTFLKSSVVLYTPQCVGLWAILKPWYLSDGGRINQCVGFSRCASSTSSSNSTVTWYYVGINWICICKL